MDSNWNSQRPRELFLFAFNKIYTDLIANDKCKSKAVSTCPEFMECWFFGGNNIFNFNYR